MLDFRLQTFLTLSETMNYRRAAELLHITQPAVTQHIKYLENAYHCKLFTYSGHTLTMTPQAQALQKYASAVRYQERRLRAELEQAPGCHLRVGATKTVGDYVIGEHAARFLANPDNHLFLEVDNTRQILSMVDRGELDFAIVEGYFDRADYECRVYREEPFLGFCAAEHAFANRTVPLERVLKEGLIVREEGSGTRNILIQALQERNYSLEDFPRVVRVNQFRLLETLVARGCGVTFAYLAAGDQNPELAPFQVEGWELRRSLSYVCLPNDTARALMDCFDSYR